MKITHSTSTGFRVHDADAFAAEMAPLGVSTNHNDDGSVNVYCPGAWPTPDAANVIAAHLADGATATLHQHGSSWGPLNLPTGDTVTIAAVGITGTDAVSTWRTVLSNVTGGHF